MAELPVVDLTASSARDSLDAACRELGFFELVGHDVSDSDGAEVIEAARLILMADLAEMEQLDVADDPNFRGFERAGDRQAFEIGRETCSPGRSLCGPNRWPTSVRSTGARAVLERHFDSCRTIAEHVVDLMADAGILGDQLTDRDLHGGPSHLRVWRYGPGAVSLPAHADHGFLTLLLAPDPGLEIRGPDGTFFGAPTVAGRSLIVNVGRLLAHVSGGQYLAAVHRVRSDGGQERMSAPYFHAPNDDLRIAPPVEPGGEPRSIGEYVEWGYAWQRQVNAGESVDRATRGAIDY